MVDQGVDGESVGRWIEYAVVGRRVEYLEVRGDKVRQASGRNRRQCELLLIACCYLAAVLFVLVLAAIARVYVGMNLFKFIRYAREEFVLALGTASTEAALLGADRIMDSMRVFVNLLGNCLATFVAKWEGRLDTARMHCVLNGDAPIDELAPATQPAEPVRRLAVPTPTPASD
ncbi:cation:dicarboxylate symporter family transporter [Kribbella rubisoli]|uniref:cation:dicarboxylate symporter family transporter n=1 Tax=Kribbella rubisoli TaxID=3075929 RepID=UPI0018E58350|nr:cation:dicarboxylase symporter family transporter [Kribbella rubisoli]